MFKKAKFFILFTIFLLLNCLSIFADQKQNQTENLKKIANFIQIFKENSFLNLSDEEITQKMINGFLKEVDQYGNFFINQNEYKIFNEKLRNNYNGVGIWLKKENNFFQIERIEENSIASKAGLQIGDILLSINNKKPEKTGSLECEIDKNLSLFIARNELGIKTENELMNANKKFEILLSCHNLKQKNIEFSMIDTETGFLKIHSFAEGISKDFDQIFKSTATSLKNLIIDLRDNGGGLREEAYKLLLHFFDKKVLLFSLKDKNGQIVSKFESKPEMFLKNFSNLNLILLVNENSASASEIFASALKENHKALIIGRKTFGKGFGQSIIPIEHDKFLKITTSVVLTPNGNEIQDYGIQPDIILDENFQFQNFLQDHKIICSQNELNSIISSDEEKLRNDIELYITYKILKLKTKCILGN